MDNIETVFFTREYNLESGLLRRVDMREPTTGDIRSAMAASQKYQGDTELRDMAKEQHLLVNLTGLTPRDIDTLSACDYERLQIALLILRADPDNRPAIRKNYAVGGDKPSDSRPAASEGNTQSLESPENIASNSARP